MCWEPPARRSRAARAFAPVHKRRELERRNGTRGDVFFDLGERGLRGIYYRGAITEWWKHRYGGVTATKHE